MRSRASRSADGTVRSLANAAAIWAWISPSVLAAAGAGSPRRSQPSERDLDLAGLQLPVLARVDEIGVAQVPDDTLRIDERSQRVEPLGGIVALIGLEQWVNPVPVALEQAVDQAESGGETGDTLGARESPRQVDRDAEILAAKQEGLCQLDDLGPVRILAGLDGVADTLLRLAPSRLFELEEGEVVLEVRPARGRVFGFH